MFGIIIGVTLVTVFNDQQKALPYLLLCPLPLNSLRQFIYLGGGLVALFINYVLRSTLDVRQSPFILIISFELLMFSIDIVQLPSKRRKPLQKILICIGLCFSLFTINDDFEDALYQCLIGQALGLSLYFSIIKYVLRDGPNLVQKFFKDKGFFNDYRDSDNTQLNELLKYQKEIQNFKSKIGSLESQLSTIVSRMGAE